MSEAPRYGVHVERDDEGWRAVITGPDGEEALVRRCASENEARLFASTVEQHLGWLSEARFRQYYRL